MNGIITDQITFARLTRMTYQVYYDGGYVADIRKCSPSGKPAWQIVDAPTYMGLVREDVAARFIRDNLAMVLGHPELTKETKMSEPKLEWRAMTADELDQWDPQGANAIAETPALMEEHMSSVKVAVDEYVICIEYSLPQYRPDDPDVLLATRDHSMGMANAKAWVEQNLPLMVWRKQLIEAGFHTEIL